MNPTRILVFSLLFTLCTGEASPVHAARYTVKPAADSEDGQLVDGTTWDYRISGSSVPDLLLTLGLVSGTRYDIALAYQVLNLAEGASVEDAHLRFNEQGGNLAAGLTVQITGAMTVDPSSSSGAARFALPRTNASVSWTVPADWDSSGQLIAKYEESPDVSDVLNEIASQPGWDASPKLAIFLVEVVSPASGTAFLRTDDTHFAYIGGGNAGILPVRLIVSETLHDTFYGKELLCRPEPGAVQVNVVPRFETDAYVEWGADSTSFTNSTSPVTIPGAAAQNFAITGLDDDARVFYRLRFRRAGDVEYLAGPAHGFRSLPTINEEARLCVTSDIHVTNSTAQGVTSDLTLLDETLPYMGDFQGNDGYHAWIDLGDLVVIRATRIAFDEEEVEQRYREAREKIDLVGHSVPLIFVRGNHEEVNGWDDNGGPNNTMVWSGRMLLKYLQPPVPSAFVSGNETAHPQFGVPGDYFAMTIGNLRLRCLDPYLFSTTRPHNGHGEVGGSLNGWDWSLGETQYLWLANDLQTKPAPYSLVALHHLTSCYTGSGQYYGRGGIEIAKHSIAGRPTFEWGGENSSGVDILATERPEYVDGAVHDMLVGGGNQVVMKGHDHFHARQSLDGMTYITLAKPDDTGITTGNLWGWRFFAFYPDAVTFFAPNSGFLSITADAAQATYEYIQTFPVAGRGTVLDSFTLFPAPVGAGEVSPAAPLRTSIEIAGANPTREGTRLDLTLARAGRVRVEMIDLAGRLVRVLDDGPQDAGHREVTWDGRDTSGSRVASGVYFARLVTEGGRVDSVKMIVLR